MCVCVCVRVHIGAFVPRLPGPATPAHETRSNKVRYAHTHTGAHTHTLMFDCNPKDPQQDSHLWLYIWWHVCLCVLFRYVRSFWPFKVVDVLLLITASVIIGE